jgi:hypothetical protein
LVITGAASVTKYATIGKEPIVSFYYNGNPRNLLGIPNMDIDFGSRFPNFRLIRTNDLTAFLMCALKTESGGPHPCSVI